MNDRLAELLKEKVAEELEQEFWDAVTNGKADSLRHVLRKSSIDLNQKHKNLRSYLHRTRNIRPL